MLQESHKCPCAEGLECKVTQELTTPGTSITLGFIKQCMPPDEDVEIKKFEMTEN